jgi:NADP-dependent 3-hydroxy acid dehydrogenase YdfG
MSALTPAHRPAVVSGASSGIGAATARALGAIGHPVVLGARRLDRCRQVADEIRGGGGTAHAVALDLTDPVSIKAFAAESERLVGPIEVVVSNAGETQPGTALGADTSSFERHFQVNVLGAQALVALVGSEMVTRQRGDIVFVTSEVVESPRPGMAPYVTSKWAIEGLARAMRMELEGSGVRVSVVRPGPTLTEMGWDWDPAVTGDLLTQWQRWGLVRHMSFLAPDGVASAVAAVVSAPPGVHFTLIEVEPEAPVEGKPGP